MKELDNYNGETEHDIWVDFDNYDKPAPPMFSMKTPLTNIDNLNDWD